jgi:hypothetical protein
MVSTCKRYTTALPTPAPTPAPKAIEEMHVLSNDHNDEVGG